MSITAGLLDVYSVRWLHMEFMQDNMQMTVLYIFDVQLLYYGKFRGENGV